LKLVKSSLGEVGNIAEQGKGCIQYRVSSLQDLTNVIIPHFDKYPLITQKKADFELFKRVIELMNRKEHLTPDGLQEIVNIRASINLGLSDGLKAAFPNTIPVARPVVVDQEIKDPHWLSGFVTGEGCFFIDIAKTSSCKVGVRVQLRFQMSQHIRDAQLMKNLICYLGCGKYYKVSNREMGKFVVSGFSDNINILIPFFKKYPIEGVKVKDFADFCKVSELVKGGVNLSPEGIEQIRGIKASMNKGRLHEESDNSSFSLDTAEEKSLYMYTRDKSILYHHTTNEKEFLGSLKIHNDTFAKHLENGTYYLGKYLFTRELEPAAKFKGMSLSELAKMLNKDREKFRRKKINA
jgi:hypothetical protein